MPITMPPKPVSVSCWGELLGERKVAGVFRVLVAGQQAGAFQRAGSGWEAQVHGLRRTEPTTHESADDALRAIVRSAWARRLGARAASRVYWSDRARRAARRGGAR
jgi:hypothetical protein